ncbi:MAG: ABATE domain-containing protein [Candidatus Sulfotelmatobacter sp.]
MSRISKSLFELTGGRLCLDFANTVDDRPTSNPKSRLKGYADLLAFGVQTGVLSASEAREAAALETNRPRYAAELYRRAVALRERIFRIFSATATTSNPPLKDMLALNAVFRAANARAVVLPLGEGFRWVWQDKKNMTDRLLWEIIRSAMLLLTSDDTKLVRQCAGDDCDWLFIDNSRSSNRRWCEMKTCGNRHKAREFYRRKMGRRS